MMALSPPLGERLARSAVGAMLAALPGCWAAAPAEPLPVDVEVPPPPPAQGGGVEPALSGEPGSPGEDPAGLQVAADPGTTPPRPPMGWDGRGPMRRADCCKGMNDCKGKGMCKTDQNECKGRNECKGKGGCKPIDCAGAP